ncbi:hypothetical protein, partial [Pricia sp.]|uniref:hypothetical protein n=1 Tax=Pricia sp. TaxID=2268138 RepID=UPI003593B982
IKFWSWFIGSSTQQFWFLDLRAPDFTKILGSLLYIHYKATAQINFRFTATLIGETAFDTSSFCIRLPQWVPTVGPIP